MNAPPFTLLLGAAFIGTGVAVGQEFATTGLAEWAILAGVFLGSGVLLVVIGARRAL